MRSGFANFTHPQSATPADDLNGGYRWSVDLASFHADGVDDGNGRTVSFLSEPDTPTVGITTVTATLGGPASGTLFVRVEATQSAP